MAFHIRQVQDDHKIWKMAEAILLSHVTMAFKINPADAHDTDEYVYGMGAICDFLYGLSKLERLRDYGSEIKTIGVPLVVSINEAITNDKAVRELVAECARGYRYTSYCGDDDYDLVLNRLFVEQMYAKLFNERLIAFYERQEYTVTTKKVNL